MKQYLCAFGALLLLVGAGCTNATPAEDTNTSPATKQAGQETTIQDTMDDTTPIMKGDIMLTAEPRGNGEVYFAWELPADTEYEGFILVRGEDMNPMNDGLNYWFRQYYTRRAVTWTEIPSGDWHFRICGLVDGDCAVYSNDVMVTVE